MVDARFDGLDWMAGVAAEKILTSNHNEGRMQLVASSKATRKPEPKPIPADAVNGDKPDMTVEEAGAQGFRSASASAAARRRRARICSSRSDPPEQTHRSRRCRSSSLSPPPSAGVHPTSPWATPVDARRRCRSSSSRTSRRSSRRLMVTVVPGQGGIHLPRLISRGGLAAGLGGGFGAMLLFRGWQGIDGGRRADHRNGRGDDSRVRRVAPGRVDQQVRRPRRRARVGRHRDGVAVGRRRGDRARPRRCHRGGSRRRPSVRRTVAGTSGGSGSDVTPEVDVRVDATATAAATAPFGPDLRPGVRPARGPGCATPNATPGCTAGATRRTVRRCGGTAHLFSASPASHPLRHHHLRSRCSRRRSFPTHLVAGAATGAAERRRPWGTPRSSAQRHPATRHRRRLRLPVSASGCSSSSSLGRREEAGHWPLVSARLISVLMFLGIVLDHGGCRPPGAAVARRGRPGRRARRGRSPVLRAVDPVRAPRARVPGARLDVSGGDDRVGSVHLPEAHRSATGHRAGPRSCCRQPARVL